MSYVRYLNNSELVSASTDSTLRMWDTKACTAARTFSGHNNEKNFVGLSVDADFIACGSESNEVSLPFRGSVASYTQLVMQQQAFSSWAAVSTYLCMHTSLSLTFLLNQGHNMHIVLYPAVV